MNKREAPAGAEELNFNKSTDKIAQASRSLVKSYGKPEDEIKAIEKQAESVEEVLMVTEAESLTKEKLIFDEFKRLDNELKKRAS
jgi:hypothetical protein